MVSNQNSVELYFVLSFKMIAVSSTGMAYDDYGQKMGIKDFRMVLGSKEVNAIRMRRHRSN